MKHHTNILLYSAVAMLATCTLSCELLSSVDQPEKDEDFALLYTTNGGNSWDAYSNGQAATGEAIAQTINTTLIAGDDRNSLGAILQMRLGEVLWTRVGIAGDISNSHGFDDIVSDNISTNAIAMSDGEIFRTTDEGIHWTQVYSALYKTQLLAGSIQVGMFGLVVGKARVSSTGATDKAFILRSTTNGISWSPVGLNLDGELHDVCIAYPDIAFAVGRIYRTPGFESGNASMIQRSTDAGITWDTLTFTMNYFLNGVACANADTVVVVGAGGLIMQTEDGGVTWSQQTSGTQSHLHAVVYHFGTWVAVGDNGVILKSTDGGKTWQQLTSNTTRSLRDIVMYGGANDFGATVVGE